MVSKENIEPRASRSSSRADFLTLALLTSSEEEEVEEEEDEEEDNEEDLEEEEMATAFAQVSVVPWASIKRSMASDLFIHTQQTTKSNSCQKKKIKNDDNSQHTTSRSHESVGMGSSLSKNQQKNE